MRTISLMLLTGVVFSNVVGASGDLLTSDGEASIAAVGSEPDVAAMKQAVQMGRKVGVPVDVRYALGGVVAVKDQPASLDIAVIPRFDGDNLQVTFLASDSVSVAASGNDMIIAKVKGAAIYRRHMMVTPQRADAAQLRVMVSMDAAGGRYTSIFTIPLGSREPDAVDRKQRASGRR